MRDRQLVIQSAELGGKTKKRTTLGGSKPTFLFYSCFPKYC